MKLNFLQYRQDEEQNIDHFLLIDRKCKKNKLQYTNELITKIYGIILL